MSGGRLARACGRDRSGAVYVEFLIAFLPVFLFFSGLFQLGMIEIADLVTQHAAVTAARAAVVVLPDDPAYYDTEVDEIGGERYGDIRAAAVMTLQAIDPSPRVDVCFPSSAGGTHYLERVEPHAVVYAQVHYQYACRVPIGNLLVCGAGGAKTLVAESAMPNQGANEEYE